MKRSFIFILVFIVLWAAACDKHEALLDHSPYEYHVPPQTDDGWQTDHLDDVGINDAPLIQLLADMQDGKYEEIHSLLFVKDGRLVFEQYFPGHQYDWDEDQFKGPFIVYDMLTLHNIHSVTKSIVSCVVGMAIAQGHIGSVHEKVFDFFPEYSHLKNANNSRITLEHLLTMTAGLEWNEDDVPPGDIENDVVQLFVVSDPIAYVLSKPVVTTPGSAYYYNSGGVNVLGEIIRKATGKRIDHYCHEVLFHPLDIKEFEWNFIQPEIVFTSGDLRLRPRDMAKLGVLYLNEGIWEGQNLLPQSWIDASFHEHVSFSGSRWFGYGYLWWLRKDTVESTSIYNYHALGWGGQRSIVFPEQNMVVVFTGGYYVSTSPVSEIVVEYILPAIK